MFCRANYSVSIPEDAKVGLSFLQVLFLLDQRMKWVHFGSVARWQLGTRTQARTRP